jgi:hypothetical protein
MAPQQDVNFYTSPSCLTGQLEDVASIDTDTGGVTSLTLIRRPVRFGPTFAEGLYPATERTTAFARCITVLDRERTVIDHCGVNIDGNDFVGDFCTAILDYSSCDAEWEISTDFTTVRYRSSEVPNVTGFFVDIGSSCNELSPGAFPSRGGAADGLTFIPLSQYDEECRRQRQNEGP